MPRAKEGDMLDMMLIIILNLESRHPADTAGRRLSALIMPPRHGGDGKQLEN